MAILLIAIVGMAYTFGLFAIGAYGYQAAQKMNQTSGMPAKNIQQDVTKNPVITPVKTGGGGMNQTANSKTKPKRAGNLSMGD
ncbi:Uncharacterised protein [uncultured archaeon]|nr:Uncharacterised protein [uncultured archaeon]